MQEVLHHDASSGLRRHIDELTSDWGKVKSNLRQMPVPTELDPAPKGYRLHTRDGMLWSFGQDDLVFFDGTKWERIICPDNAVP